MSGAIHYSFKSIPPRGLPHSIVLKYFPDDERSSLPSATACLAMIQLPTTHSTVTKNMQSFDITLEFQSKDLLLFNNFDLYPKAEKIPVNCRFLKMFHIGCIDL